MFGSIIFPKTRYGFFFRFDNAIAAGKSRQDQTRQDFYPPGIAIHGRKKSYLVFKNTMLPKKSLNSSFASTTKARYLVDIKRLIP